MNKFKLNLDLITLISATIGLLLFSYIFALERIISGDTATYLFNLINQKTFNFGSFRFIAIFTQIFPIILIKLKASFQVVLISYSINLMLFHVFFLWLLYFLNDKVAFYTLLAAHFISSGLMFYYPVSEYQMGLTLSILILALIRNVKFLESKWYWPVMFFLFSIISYSHPLIIIFISLVFIFHTFHQQTLSKQLILSYVLFLVLFVSKYLFFEVPNDSGNMLDLKHLKFFPLNAFLIFWNQALTFDFLLIFVFFLTLVLMLQAKSYKALIFFIIFTYANFYLSLSKLGNQGFMYYHAHIYQTISFIVALFFVHYFMKYKTKKWITQGGLFAIVVVGFILINYHSSFSKSRISYFLSLINQTQELGTNRGIVQSHEIQFSKNGWFWAMDIETLLCSTYYNNDAVTVIIKNRELVQEEELMFDNLFMVYWTNFKANDVLDMNYFKLEPNTYQFIFSSEQKQYESN